MKQLSLWLVLFLCALGHALAASRPHIVFVFTDDFGWGDIGAYGGALVPTPNMDRMAREGMRFEQFYVASPICSPSRTGFMTGMFPSRWRITSFLQSRKGNAACEQDDFLDPKAPSIARILKNSGYTTGHFGKWHMGGGRDVTNAPSIREYGFDEWATTYESPDPHPDLTATNWIWSEHDKVKRWDRTGFFVDKTLDFLKRHPDQPCFINLWPDDTHDPFVPGPELAAKYGAGKNHQAEPNFKAVLEEYDRQMGRLLDGLKELGIAANTLVVFTGDNGPLPTYQQRRTGGLRGSKLSLYEGGIRQPLLVWSPGRVPAGALNTKTVLNSVDLLPTFCRLAGAKVPDDIAARLDGEDLGAAFSGAQPLRTNPLFWEYGRNDTSFRYAPSPANRSPRVALREADWKILLNPDGTGAELYDIAKDRNETTNLAEKEPEITKRMSEAALKWRKSLP
jgi:arylsulfatase A-like enzyme